MLFSIAIDWRQLIRACSKGFDMYLLFVYLTPALPIVKALQCFAIVNIYSTNKVFCHTILDGSALLHLLCLFTSWRISQSGLDVTFACNVVWSVSEVAVGDFGDDLYLGALKSCAVLNHLSILIKSALFLIIVTKNWMCVFCRRLQFSTDIKEKFKGCVY